MYERSINANGDISCDENGHIVRCSSMIESVSQRIKCVLRTIKGELFNNKDMGVEWFGLLGNDVVLSDYVVNRIKSVIEAIPNVKKAENISIDVTKRNLSGTFNVVLNDGTTTEIEV